MWKLAPKEVDTMQSFTCMLPIDLLQQAAAIISKYQQLLIQIVIKSCMMVKGKD